MPGFHVDFSLLRNLSSCSVATPDGRVFTSQLTQCRNCAHTSSHGLSSNWFWVCQIDNIILLAISSCRSYLSFFIAFVIKKIFGWNLIISGHLLCILTMVACCFNGIRHKKCNILLLWAYFGTYILTYIICRCYWNNGLESQSFWLNLNNRRITGMLYCTWPQFCVIIFFTEGQVFFFLIYAAYVITFEH